MWHTFKYCNMCITGVPGREETKRSGRNSGWKLPTVNDNSLDVMLFVWHTACPAVHGSLNLPPQSPPPSPSLHLPQPCFFFSKITIPLYSKLSKLSSELVLSHSSTYLFPCQLLFLVPFWFLFINYKPIISTKFPSPCIFSWLYILLTYFLIVLTFYLVVWQIFIECLLYFRHHT